MSNQTSDNVGGYTLNMPPLALLDLIMYGSTRERNNGTVDQAYEELKRWIKEKEVK